MQKKFLGGWCWYIFYAYPLIWTSDLNKTHFSLSADVGGANSSQYNTYQVHFSCFESY